MNTPFVVAQANTTGSTAGSRSLRTIKVSKPQGDQAITVQLGYDQNYKLDLSSIANEKITLVHIGEKLIILFDNKSTVTVEPFFDSMNVPLSNVTVEAAGRDFSSGDFALAFPITTDQSVLTAAGAAGVAGSPASGGDFHGPSVEPLNEPNPLPLLGPEELGNFVITQQLGIAPTAAATATAPSVVLNHELSITKVVDTGEEQTNQANFAGQEIHYTINVTNTGESPLTGVTLTDPYADGAPTFVGGDTNSNGQLDVGETWSYTATHTVTQDEMNAGDPLINTAEVTDSQGDDETAQATTPVEQHASMSVAKDADHSSVGAAGDVINYTITVDNTGNINLTNVVISDPFADAAPTLDSGDDGDNVLETNETWVYKATHTVSQEEINAGADLVNTATVDTDQTVPLSDDATTTVSQNPSLTIAKSTTDTTVSAAGNVIHYTIDVDNTGGVDLTGVTMTDAFANGGATYVSGDDGDNVLETNETWHYTATHTVTQAEMNAGGTLTNTATVDTDQTQPQSDDATTAVVQPRLIQSADFGGVVEEEHLKLGLGGTFPITAVGNEDTNSVGGLDLDTNPNPLTSGEPGENFNVTTNVTSGSMAVSGGTGTLNFHFTSGLEGTQALFADAPTAMTSGGAPVLYHVAGNSLLGYVNVGPAGYVAGVDHVVFSFDITNTTTGAYTFTLFDKIDHHTIPAADGLEGVRALNLNGIVEVTDSSLQTLALNGSINIIDDVPTAMNHTASVQEGSSVGTVDVVFIVDVSGSMGSAGGGNVGFDVPGFSDDRIGLARYSMQQLLTNHPEILNVQFTRFSDTANTQVWMSRTDALNFISANGNWSSGGTTNYDAALGSEINAYNTSSRPLGQAEQTVVYFLSDGAPNQPSADPGITNNGTGSDVSVTEWQTFATAPANDISQVFAIGLGSGVNAANLAPISYPNTDVAAPIGTEDNIILINNSDLSSLTQTFDNLLSSVASSTGNVLTDGVLTTSFGADGGHIQSIAIHGTTYTWNGLTGASSVITETGAIIGTINGVTLITAATGLGGQLEFHFAAGSGHNAGDWSYTSPTNVSADTHDLFPYVIIDNDGDTSSFATLDITVTNVNQAPSITSNGGGATASLNVNENTVTVTTVTATDPDATPGIYSIVGGSDQLKFTIGTSSGVLSFTAAQNFEVPTDSDANNSYVVQVQVADGAGGLDTQTITVNVQDVNEQPSAGADQIVSAAENVIDTAVLATVAGTDPDFGGGNDGANNFENLSYSLVAGNGSGLFEINSSGQVSLVAGQHLDFETAQQHVLTVRVTDGPGLLDDVQVTINVTNVNEAPTATNDTVITNISGSGAAIAIPDAALLINDTDPESQALTISSVGSASSGSVAHAATTTTFTDNNTNGGSFSYTAQDGGSPNLTGTASVTIDRSQAGENQLDGTSASEILLGRNGSADTIVGGGGKDYMVGGTGNDTFLYNATGDSSTSSASADVIADFVHGQDIIDLTAIDANTNLANNQAFTFNVTTPTANGVWYTEVGPNTIISMDTNGSAASAEMVIVLTGIGKGLTIADFHL